MHSEAPTNWSGLCRMGYGLSADLRGLRGLARRLAIADARAVTCASRLVPGQRIEATWRADRLW